MKILDEFIGEIRNFGVKKASRLSGISYETIYHWTQRKAIPTLINAQKVANVMGLEFLIFDKLED